MHHSCTVRLVPGHEPGRQLAEFEVQARQVTARLARPTGSGACRATPASRRGRRGPRAVRASAAAVRAGSWIRRARRRAAVADSWVRNRAIAGDTDCGSSGPGYRASADSTSPALERVEHLADVAGDRRQQPVRPRRDVLGADHLAQPRHLRAHGHHVEVLVVEQHGEVVGAQSLGMPAEQDQDVGVTCR